MDIRISEECPPFFSWYMTNKILSTFWRYQKACYGGENSRRFTFTVGRLNPEAFGFTYAIKELALEGLVFSKLVSSVIQFGLTDRGIGLCKKYEHLLDETCVFDFD